MSEPFPFKIALHGTPLKEAVIVPTKEFRAVVLGDLHGNFYDPSSLALARKVVGAVQPSLVILNGEVVDFYAISRFPRDPTRKLKLPEEILHVRKLLAEMYSWAPNARWLYIAGNHERRLQYFLWSEAEELSGLEELRIQSLLKLDDLGITYLQHETKPVPAWETAMAQVKLGKLFIAHGDTIRRASSTIYIARSISQHLRVNCLIGHWHRYDVYIHHSYDGSSHGVWVIPCLCLPRPDYSPDRLWANGMAVIDMTKTGGFQVNPLNFTWRGKTVSTSLDGVEFEQVAIAKDDENGKE